MQGFFENARDNKNHIDIYSQWYYSKLIQSSWPHFWQNLTYPRQVEKWERLLFQRRKQSQMGRFKACLVWSQSKTSKNGDGNNKKRVDEESVSFLTDASFYLVRNITYSLTLSQFKPIIILQVQCSYQSKK